MYEYMGRVYARLADTRGQGTVEYVGLILLLGVVLAGVVKAGQSLDSGIDDVIIGKLKAAINKVAAP
jgi:hypothetical protein